MYMSTVSSPDIVNNKAMVNSASRQVASGVMQSTSVELELAAAWR